MFPLLLINVITASARKSGAHRVHTLGLNPAEKACNRWPHVKEKPLWSILTELLCLPTGSYLCSESAETVEGSPDNDCQTHTHTRTQAHTNTHRHTHIHRQTYAQTHTYTESHAHAHAHTDTYTHYKHAHTHIHIHTHTHTCCRIKQRLKWV